MNKRFTTVYVKMYLAPTGSPIKTKFEILVFKELGKLKDLEENQIFPPNMASHS